MKQILFIVLFSNIVVTTTFAQHLDYTKMSSMVRRLTLGNHTSISKAPKTQANNSWVCAFIEIDDDGEAILTNYGGESLAKFGNIHIARIPIKNILTLSSLSQVKRIEANSSQRTTLDTMAVILRANDVYHSQSLPQAFTGKGVVIGIQDIGFDYTHPTFLDTLNQRCRISAVWDMLANDDGSVPVGATYYGDSVLATCHSRDGNDQTHGTHTAGIAAGNGYRTPFRGIAYESNICLVANATSNNASMISPDRVNLYTYAMDALGFKYIFDYASERGLPCVISFSEGSSQDFRGDDRLYYQVLDSLVGPGRILVASAGNDGLNKTYFHKPSNLQSIGSFIQAENGCISFTVKGDRHFDIRLVCYGESNDTLCISSQQPGIDTLYVKDWNGMNVMACTYLSAYEATDIVMDVSIQHATDHQLSVEIVGKGTDISFYKGSGRLVVNDINSDLSAGEYSHSIASPASAPAVICVGSTAYRQDIYTYLGVHRVYDMGHNGERTYTSSVGPTFDERIKPDVMAPGTNIVSAYSSYYLEHHPQAWDVVNSDKEHFDFGGRIYAWNYNSGTSMSTPAVAGTIALWLEACPTLSPNDIRKILASTAHRRDLTLNYPNNYYGYGEIDAYAGLLQILELTGIPEISNHQARGITIYPVEDGVELKFDTAPQSNFTTTIYSIDGLKVVSHQFPPYTCTYRLKLDNIARGIYIIQINTGNKFTTGSQLIRH